MQKFLEFRTIRKSLEQNPKYFNMKQLESEQIEASFASDRHTDFIELGDKSLPQNSDQRN